MLEKVKINQGRRRPASSISADERGRNRHHRSSTIADPLAECLELIAPSWPLQNIMAINPFWYKRKHHIAHVFAEFEELSPHAMLPPTSCYRLKHRQNEISNLDLEQAHHLAQKIWPELPNDLRAIDGLRAGEKAGKHHVSTFAERIGLHEIVIDDLARYCAAYFDDRQSIARYPWQSGSFWSGWLEAQIFDRSMSEQIYSGFAEIVDGFRQKTPREAILAILEQLNLPSKESVNLYLQRCLLTINGWASQFKLLEWQRSKGTFSPKISSLLDLLAVRLVYDFVALRKLEEHDPEQLLSWRSNLVRATKKLVNPSYDFQLRLIWQTAAEFAHQRSLAAKIRRPAENRSNVPPQFQIAFCIDVRSELIRRRLEQEHNDIQTLGFAGFFAAALATKNADERQESLRLPALISPNIQMDRSIPDTGAPLPSQIKSAMRSLRKGGMSSFLFVEIFGILATIDLLLRTLRGLVGRLRGPQLPSRFADRGFMAKAKSTAKGELFQYRVSIAQRILQSLSLHQSMAKVVVICGHGSHTSNNAMASALDCGACGGHAGDVNARYVAELLNDPAIRRELGRRGIFIPDGTRFLAAVHETVTDTVYLLDTERFPTSFQAAIQELKGKLHSSLEMASKERQREVAPIFDENPARRSRNWSELRPEWGLVGNSSFIIAPRSYTRSQNLGGRVFLHDYDWRHDQDIKILEGLLTAPMIVTHWINFQYFASSVCPEHFGSGNKTLHNITGETGVLEGNGGDLRIGLPQQSIHDGLSPTHEPLRLSVYIAAPRQSIETIIQRNEVVRQLACNEWLYILQVDPETGVVWRRSPQGTYSVVDSDGNRGRAERE